MMLRRHVCIPLRNFEDFAASFLDAERRLLCFLQCNEDVVAF